MSDIPKIEMKIEKVIITPKERKLKDDYMIDDDGFIVKKKDFKDNPNLKIPPGCVPFYLTKEDEKKINKRIYLAGCADEIEYRKTINEKYSNEFIILDPIKLVDSQENITNKELVELDKLYIKLCDILIAYINKPTFGTIMEVIYAYENKKQIYCINTNQKYINDIWLNYHTHKFFISIEECFEYIRREVRENE